MIMYVTYGTYQFTLVPENQFDYEENIWIVRVFIGHWANPDEHTPLFTTVHGDTQSVAFQKAIDMIVS